MKTRRFGWLMFITGAMLLLVWLVSAPASGAHAGNAGRAPAVTSAGASAHLSQSNPGRLAHTADITFTPAFTAHLPLIAYELPFQPDGIHGQVTYQGLPIDGLEIQLALWNHVGNSWISNSGDTLYATTQAGGHYRFTTAASLNSDQKYTVVFKNTAHDALFLASWQSSSVYTYTAGQVLPGGDFEIAEMVYLSPSNFANVGLPVAFQWLPRIGSSSDNYVFELFRPNEAVLFRTPGLGYTGTYTLNSLPVGFTTGMQYGWYMWVYGPGDSYGLTNQYGWVTFH